MCSYHHHCQNSPAILHFLHFSQIYCHCGGTDYIDEDLYITCDKCNKRKSIFDDTFICQMHSDGREPNVMNIVKAISTFTRFNSLPKDMARKMMEKVMNYNY